MRMIGNLSVIGPGEAYALGCALAWGTAVVLFKKSGESLAPFALNYLKSWLGIALFLPTILLLHGTALPVIPATDLAVILFSGFIGIAAGDTLYLRALNAIGAGRMAAAQTLYSPCVIGLSLLLLGEHLSLPQWLGVAAVLGGVFLVSYVREQQALQRQALLRGMATAALAMFAMALAVVMAKPMLERYDFLWVVTLRIAGGVAGMSFIAARRASQMTAQYRAVRHWPQVLAGAVIGEYFSMMLWLAGYKYTKASVAAVLNEFSAIFILLLALLFLRERVTPRQAAGVLLAVAGVMLVVST